MRICLISYEYPPDTGIGGNGTYVYNTAQAFSERGIFIEVITASQVTYGTIVANEFLTVTKIKCTNTAEFIKLSPIAALERHRVNPFDLIEVPEYGAEGLFIKDKIPNVPLVVKLHTPKFLIKKLNDFYFDNFFLRKIKIKLGLGYKKENDVEFIAIQKADFITSPSLSLKKIIAEQWNIPSEKIIHTPNLFKPNQSFLNISSKERVNKVLFIGRLETRKGVLNLAKAIPQVVTKFPDIKFIFLGKDRKGPKREKSMKKVIQMELGAASANVAFYDHVPLTEIQEFYADSSICVFPSLWENFPNVCLEAMSAANGIIASKNGGMNDMLTDIDGGILIDPHDSKAIANAIIEMVDNKKFRIEAGLRCREKIIQYYGYQLIDQLIKLYQTFTIKSINEITHLNYNTN